MFRIVPEVILAKRRLPERIPYQPGDCLAFQLSDGEYGGLVVLGLRVISPRKTLTLIGSLHHKSHAVPRLEVFEERNWLTLSHHSWNNRVHIGWVDPYEVSDFQRRAILVGRIEITPEDPSDSNSYYSSWVGLGLQIELQAAWDMTHPS